MRRWPDFYVSGSNTMIRGESHSSGMRSNLHQRICALVAGLIVHAVLIASLHLACFDSNSVHVAERLDRALDRAEVLRTSGQPSAETIEAAVLPAKGALPPPCPNCSNSVRSALFASQPTPGNEKFVAVLASSDGPHLWSPPLIGRVTGVVSTNAFAQLEQLRTVVLLI